MPETLSYVELDRALSRCMEEHPPQGIERQMHPDAHVMSGLWAFMTYMRLDLVDVNTIKPAVVEAIARWTERN